MKDNESREGGVGKERGREECRRKEEKKKKKKRKRRKKERREEKGRGDQNRKI